MNLKKTTKVFLWYLLSILIFGCVYLVFWVINTSYFIVTEEYNQQTLRPTVVIDELPSKFDKRKDKNVLDLNEQITLQYDKLGDFEKRELAIEDSLKLMHLRSEKLNEQLWKSHDKNLADSITSRTAFISKQKRQVQKLIADNMERIGNDGGVAAAAKALDYNMKLQNLTLQESKLVLMLHDRGFSDYFDLKLFEQNRLIGDTLQRLYHAKSPVLDSILAVKIAISDLGIGYHFNRMERLGLADFIYFSSGIATASNFGDILPNHTYIRIFVFLQILLSVVLFGYFVNGVIEGIQKMK